jgi:hypothetical protein
LECHDRYFSNSYSSVNRLSYYGRRVKDLFLRQLLALGSPKRGSAHLFFKVCGSSHRWHPRAADLQNRSALHLLRCGFSLILTASRFQVAGQPSQGADRTGLLALEWSRMHFEIVGGISKIQTVATGRGIRRLKFLRRRYGGRRWRKQKGVAAVRTSAGSIRRAQIHWYEAHGVGRTGWKIKRFLD